jgi:hypothetical protein
MWSMIMFAFLAVILHVKLDTIDYEEGGDGS